MNKQSKWLIVLSIALAISLFTIYQLSSKNIFLEDIYEQNQLAQDSMKVLKLQNATYYQKYALIQSDLTAKEIELQTRDEKILALTKANIKLKDIISQSTGTVVETGKDSGSIPFGSKIEFKDSTDFYKYLDTVFIESQSFMKRHLTFYSLISQKNYLTRNVEGKWSGYVEFKPDWVNKYLSINNLEVYVERDEFVRVESDINKFRLSIIPTFGILQKDNILFGAGLKAIFNKKHLTEITKGIGNDWLWVGYGYNFDIIK